MWRSRLIDSFCVASFFAMVPPLSAGVFLGSTNPDTIPDPPGVYEPYIIMHPKGFSGVGTQLVVKVCVASLAKHFTPTIQDAIQIWNEAVPLTQNCQNCAVWEETQLFGTGTLHSEAVVLHELGHCALGLGHINLGNQSFSNVVQHFSVTEGADGIRGSYDDVVAPLPGARVVHWFRKVDNDPVKVDATVIDIDTYSRALVDLPVGHLWPANANRVVAESLGEPDTQSVMYSAAAANTRYLGLASDEVNMIRLARTGMDTQAGTSDDYTVSLQLVQSCEQADVTFVFDVPFDPVATGECQSESIPISPPGPTRLHWALNGPLTIRLNPLYTWDAVFYDGFESGDTGGWPGQ